MRKKAGSESSATGLLEKGNTLLNHCGIRSDLIEFTVDRNPHKHAKYLPGSSIPVLVPDVNRSRPAGLRAGIAMESAQKIFEQLHYIADWGGKLVLAIPRLESVEPGPSGVYHEGSPLLLCIRNGVNGILVRTG